MDRPFVLASRKDGQGTTVSIPAAEGTVHIGGGHFVVIAGPCAVEGVEAYLALARRLKQIGVHVLRGGAFKPRTSPYSFAGLGLEGLEILAEARRQTGLPVVTEVLDPRDIEQVAACADLLQVGSRNMQNFSLLSEVGRSGKPVILKRGFSATIEEWLLAAEYILAAGNPQVVLCERGIRTFETYTRNTVDIAAVPVVKELSHLPVIIDPSHGTGRAELVRPVAKAGVAVGADGLMIEVHHCPSCALSDGQQSLDPLAFAALFAEVREMAQREGRRV
ncbi:MAG: 3-deoxy-7-phosphoheptulonate synthase [Syntrophomonadaceae bacterium]|jgi:3-deoxy-7-phosphoheptulonate synthase|nr:3-deoxy-7-phosphoheptulonate synthase [Syntrophomonadaceae bacterium]